MDSVGVWVRWGARGDAAGVMQVMQPACVQGWQVEGVGCGKGKHGNNVGETVTVRSIIT